MYVFDKKTGLKAWLSKWNEILVDPIHGTIKHNLQLADYYGCFSVVSKLPSWVPLSVYSMQHRRKDMKFFFCAHCIAWSTSHSHCTCSEKRGSPHNFFNRFKNDSAFRSYSLEKFFQGTLSDFHAIEK